MQDDALFPMLSVRETLMFSARLRLPGSMGMVEKRARVEELILALGLSACADTKIGNEEVRKGRGQGLEYIILSDKKPSSTSFCLSEKWVSTADRKPIGGVGEGDPVGACYPEELWGK